VPRTDLSLVEGSDYELLPNKAIKLVREFRDLGEEYYKEQIPNYLGLVDHSLALEELEYEKLLDKETERLNLYVRQLKDKDLALIVVFQGRDGAGKSGATERIIEAVDYDMEIFDAVHIGPPSADELAHPFLWRFGIHDRMPKFGQVRVFDRSWCERVLVEPILGITKGAPLKKSYAQIRAFEWLHASSGYILVKFWLDITKGEQERRFKKREKKKPWKLSPSDAQARKAWDLYTDAANEMFHRTATPFAPWYLVSSENKYYSRVTVLQVINRVLKEHL
jgi:AMP-polyphosphate phosphotransferase